MCAASAFGLLALLAGTGDFTVAIDPGHGGTNLGTTGLSKGMYEKHVTLEIARRVRRFLATEKAVRVVLCREADVQVPINARIRCANESGARLFISIHANASPLGKQRGSQRGFELYVLPVTPDPPFALGVDHDVAQATLSATDDVHAAWAAHQVRVTASESLAAAGRIDWQLVDALGTASNRGIKQTGAQLDVLQGLKMPSVLVEVGFLDHPEEGLFLATEAAWDKIAAALARAISDLRAREVRGRTDPGITAPVQQATR